MSIPLKIISEDFVFIIVGHLFKRVTLSLLRLSTRDGCTALLHLGVAVALKTIDVWNDVKVQWMGDNLAKSTGRWYQRWSPTLARPECHDHNLSFPTCTYRLYDAVCICMILYVICSYIHQFVA